MFPPTIQSTRDATSVRLREPTGQEEMFEWGRSPESASRFLCALDEREGVPALSLAGRDRLAADVFLGCFGDAIRAQAACENCEKPIELEFSLLDYLKSKQPDADLRGAGVRVSGQPGYFVLDEAGSGAIEFRFPTVEDEWAVEGLPAEDSERELRRRCLSESTLGRMDPTPEAFAPVERALERMTPALRGPLQTRCAHCEQSQSVDFDVAVFLMQALADERGIVAREIHCLARSYSWSLQEIASLSRSQRRLFVELIAQELDGGSSSEDGRGMAP